MRLLLLLGLQVVCLALIIAGTAVIYWPAALIVAGALGAAVIERQT